MATNVYNDLVQDLSKLLGTRVRTGDFCQRLQTVDKGGGMLNAIKCATLAGYVDRAKAVTMFGEQLNQYLLKYQDHYGLTGQLVVSSRRHDERITTPMAEVAQLVRTLAIFLPSLEPPATEVFDDLFRLDDVMGVCIDYLLDIEVIMFEEYVKEGRPSAKKQTLLAGYSIDFLAARTIQSAFPPGGGTDAELMAAYSVALSGISSFPAGGGRFPWLDGLRRVVSLLRAVNATTFDSPQSVRDYFRRILSDLLGCRRALKLEIVHNCENMRDRHHVLSLVVKTPAVVNSFKGYFATVYGLFPEPQSLRERAMGAHLDVPGDGLLFPICELRYGNMLTDAAAADTIKRKLNSFLRSSQEGVRIEGVSTAIGTDEACQSLGTSMIGNRAIGDIRAAVINFIAESKTFKESQVAPFFNGALMNLCHRGHRSSPTTHGALLRVNVDRVLSEMHSHVFGDVMLKEMRAVISPIGYLATHSSRCVMCTDVYLGTPPLG